MKINVLVLALIFNSATAFADQALEISCVTKSPSRHELPAEGAMLKGNVVLLGGSLAQGKLDDLSFADNDGKLYNFVTQNARPEVKKESGEGASALEFDYSRENTSLRSVHLVVGGELKPGHSEGEVIIERNDDTRFESEVNCEFE